MRELFGYWLPWQYSAGAVAEHLATRERVTLCDLDYMAEFQIKGSGAYDFVQQLLTNDFSSLDVGQVRYTAMCRDDGTMVDDGTLWRMGVDEFVLISGQESDSEWVSAQATEFDVEITNLTDSWTTLAIQGPRAQYLVEALVPHETVRSLRYYHFVRTRVFGENCTLARMGYTGEQGYEFHLHPRAAEAVWRALLAAGADEGVLPLGQAALESLRQEAGYLLVGNDHDSSTNPLEAGLGRVVKFGKPSFNGRHALATVRREGVQRTLVWLKLDHDAAPENGDMISIDGQPVGSITSGSYSPTQRSGVAVAYLSSRHAITGIPVDVTVGGCVQSATVSLMPLYDPGDVRTRAPATRMTLD
jgi:aminomethyltransferase